MISQFTPVISGTWTSLHQPQLAVTQTTSTHPNLTLLDLKTIVGKLRQTVCQPKTARTLLTAVVQILTKSMNGTKLEFLKDSTGIVLM